MQFDRLVKQKKLIIGLAFRLSSLRTIMMHMIIFTMIFCFSSSLTAGTSSAAVEVSAVVLSKCKINSGAVAFGSYDPAYDNSAAPLNGAGNVSISCTKNTTASISIDQGQNAGQASGTSRAMKSVSGSHYLSYDLYLDSSRSTVWNTTNTAIYTASGGAAPATISIYGTVPGNQDVTDGQYNDVVTVTAVF